jgi:hypothetical protein
VNGRFCGAIDQKVERTSGIQILWLSDVPMDKGDPPGGQAGEGQFCSPARQIVQRYDPGLRIVRLEG